MESLSNNVGVDVSDWLVFWGEVFSNLHFQICVQQWFSIPVLMFVWITFIRSLSTYNKMMHSLMKSNCFWKCDFVLLFYFVCCLIAFSVSGSKDDFTFYILIIFFLLVWLEEVHQCNDDQIWAHPVSQLDIANLVPLCTTASGNQSRVSP